MNVRTKFHGKPCNACRDISVWYKAADWPIAILSAQLKRASQEVFTKFVWGVNHSSNVTDTEATACLIIHCFRIKGSHSPCKHGVTCVAQLHCATPTLSSVTKGQLVLPSLWKHEYQVAANVRPLSCLTPHKCSDCFTLRLQHCASSLFKWLHAAPHLRVSQQHSVHIAVV